MGTGLQVFSPKPNACGVHILSIPTISNQQRFLGNYSAKLNQLFGLDLGGWTLFSAFHGRALAVY